VAQNEINLTRTKKVKSIHDRIRIRITRIASRAKKDHVDIPFIYRKKNSKKSGLIEYGIDNDMFEYQRRIYDNNYRILNKIR